MNTVNVSAPANTHVDPSEHYKGLEWSHLASLKDFSVLAYRKERGLSRKAFAEELDISIETLRKWENETAAPTYCPAFAKILEGWLSNRLSRAMELMRR